MKYNTFCPLFPGFYGTVFECNSEEQEIDYYNEENKTNYKYDDFNFDYTDYNNRIAKAFVNRLERELKAFLPIKLEFQEVVSPKEYNFKNDSINISASLSIDRLIKLIRDRIKPATQYFKDTYTSRSGFISFHSNRVYDWLRKEYILENPDYRIGALLNCLCSIEIDQDDIIYWCDDEMHISAELKESVIAE